MPAKSKKQARFMRLVRLCQRSGKCLSDEIEKAADSMTHKQAHDFASTKDSELPQHKKNKKKKKKKKYKTFKEYYELHESKNSCKCECKACFIEKNCANCSCKNCQCEGCGCKK